MISVDFNKKVTVILTDKSKHDLTVIDKQTDKVIHIEEDFKSINFNTTYYRDLIFILEDGEGNKKMFQNKLETVVIEIHSKALGDQLAWIPIVDLFQNKHNCRVVVRCYFEDLFKDYFPNIEFRHQYFEGDNVEGITEESVVANAVYVLGYSVSGKFNTNDGSQLSPVDCREVPLQHVACYQLGIEPQELRPVLEVESKPIVKGKYVVITTCATAGFKLWNNPKGFPTLVKYFKSKEYKVIDVGDGTDSIKGTISMNGLLGWDKLKNILQHAELFVSGSNGLAWLAWAVGQKVVTIDNITNTNEVFKHTKIENKNVCNSCWNDVSLIYDNTDVNYCPRKNNYICSSSITPEMVIKEIDKIL